MDNNLFTIKYFFEKYKDKETAELEEIFYKNRSDYTDVALSAIEKILNERTDRKIGITHKYCPNCQIILNINENICKCGYNFESPNLEEIKRVKQKRKVKNQIFGLIMIGLGVVALIVALSLENVEENNKKFIYGIPGMIIIIGIYTLFTGRVVKEPTGTTLDSVLGPPKELKNIDDDIEYIICPLCGKQLMKEMKYKNCPSCKTSIHNIPVKNTLAVPLVGIKNGSVGLYGFACLFSLRFIGSIISDSNGDLSIVYILGAIACALFAFNLKRIPKVALYGGVVLAILETADFVFAGSYKFINDIKLNSNPGASFVAFIGWSSIRLCLLISIFKVIRAFKKGSSDILKGK
jgi:hypothetical protein